MPNGHPVATKKEVDDRVLILEEGFKAILSEVRDLALSVQRLMEGQKTNWAQWISVGGLLAILVGGAWKLIALQTQVALIPIQQQNTTSIQDRKDIHDSVMALENRLIAVESKQVSEISERKANEAEIETQIDAGFQFMGVQFANGQRDLYEIKGTLHDMGKYPPPASAPFFIPNISNRNKK